jgi:hypothetical protein
MGGAENAWASPHPHQGDHAQMIDAHRDDGDY